MPRSLRTRLLVLVAVFAATAFIPASANAATYGTRTLKSGMTGPDVKQLQRYLGRVGHRVGSDGEFGPRTVRGLKATERDLELRADATASLRDQVMIRRAVSQAVTGGANYVAPPPPAKVVPGAIGKVTSAGFAVPPSSAPASIKAVIAAGNAIAKTPYKWGGGHGSWTDSGYDCSGSVSYALHAAGLVTSPMVSGNFSDWGLPGPGSWITVYSNGGHVYMTVAGLRFDTSARASGGSRWTTAKRSNAGFAVTHPTGL
jgi:cell wall-associated NlpC family hydrolase